MAAAPFHSPRADGIRAGPCSLCPPGLFVISVPRENCPWVRSELIPRQGCVCQPQTRVCVLTPRCPSLSIPASIVLSLSASIAPPGAATVIPSLPASPAWPQQAQRQLNCVFHRAPPHCLPGNEEQALSGRLFIHSHTIRHPLWSGARGCSKLPASPRHRGRCMLQPRGCKSLSC